jgi:thioesterase domain-containing protein
MDSAFAIRAREALERMLVREMPVAQSLGFDIAELTTDAVTLRATFDLNRNHQGSAFAGSVHALAALAGWATVWLTLQEAGIRANAVLQDSEIRYLHPITCDFTAICRFPTGPERAGLLDAVRRHRRGRVPVEVDVRAAEVAVARFRGRYVALL